MKEFEMRKTKGYCRLCESNDGKEMVVIPFRYAGKNAPILLCKSCVKHLNSVANPEPIRILTDDWEPTMRFFRD